MGTKLSYMLKRTLAAALLVSVAAPVAGAQAEPPALGPLLEAYFEEGLELFPLRATTIGDHRYDDRLGVEIGDEHRERQRAYYRKYSDALARIDPKRLAGQDRLSYQILQWQLAANLEALSFDAHLTPVTQFGGLPLEFPRLASGAGAHPFKTVKDYENFLGRVNDFQTWVDTAIANMRRGMAAGLVQPRVLIEKAIKQYDALIVDDVKQSVFFKPVADMPGFGEQDRARLTALYVQAIEGRVLPSYRKLRDFLQNEYLPKTRQAVGLSAAPRGAERYAFLARYYTTTSMTPEQIFQAGLREVRRIRGEMERVKRRVGFKGDLKAFLDHVRTDPKFFPFSSPEEVLAAYRKVETRMKPHLPKLFGIIPRSPFEVRLVEPFMAATAAAHYMRGTPDGSRPGAFYVPVPDAKRYNVTGVESLFLHEAIPGHHYQISLQQEREGLPKFRRFGGFGAYAEGWALYTEGLGGELGLYEDPYQYLGRLGAEMHRAVRLVVDVGMHMKGWTREQAIQYSLENEAISEARATAEIERYIAIPGQALSYKIGELKIVELRRDAERRLGRQFSLRDFHDEVLKDGAMPLAVLESKLDAWMASAKGRRASRRG
jgi:uncharacterized protein (DUF885 family)